MWVNSDSQSRLGHGEDGRCPHQGQQARVSHTEVSADASILMGAWSPLSPHTAQAEEQTQEHRAGPRKTSYVSPGHWQWEPPPLRAARTGKRRESLPVGAARSVWVTRLLLQLGPIPGRRPCATLTLPPPAMRPRGGGGGWPEPWPQARPSLNELHIVGGKHAKVAVGPVATPPAFIDHLDTRDEVLRVKGDLGLVS